MPRFFQGKLLVFLSAFLALSGLFLFSNAAESAWDANIYNKPYNGTLTATEWNNLLLDFPAVWLPVTFKGPVTIGTSTPTTLNVNGTITATTFSGAYTGTTGAQNVSSGAFGSNTGGGNYSFPGNVGIGTTNPGAKLQIATNLNAYSEVLRLSGYLNGYGGGMRFYSNYDSNDRRFDIQSMDNDGNPRNLIINPNGGNIGIGTNSPGRKLSVNGDVGATYFAASDSSGFVASNNGYRSWSPVQGSLTSDTDLNFGIDVDNNATNNAFIFRNNATFASGSELMRITEGGNIGIGTTNPTNILHTNAAGGIRIQTTSGNGDIMVGGYTAAGLYSDSSGVGIRGANGGLAFLAPYNGSYGSGLAVNSAGNVGIGTTTVATKFVVSGGTGNVINVLGGQVAGLNSTPTNPDHAIPLGYLEANYTPASGSLWSGTKNGNIWNGDAGVGNVGIGLTNPTSQLHVNNDFAVNGAINHSVNSSVKWTTLNLTDNTVRYLQFNQDVAAVGSNQGYGAQLKISLYLISSGEVQGGEIEKVYQLYWYNGAWSVNRSQVTNAFGIESNMVRIGEAEINGTKMRIPIWAGSGFGSGRSFAVKVEVIAGNGTPMNFFKDYAMTSSSADTFPGASYNQIENRLGIALGSNVMPSAPLHVSGNGIFTGNLGIGVTNPSYKLAVAGEAQVDGLRGKINEDFVITSHGNGAGEGFTFKTNAGGLTAFKIDYSGNVGIGTTNPGALEPLDGWSSNTSNRYLEIKNNAGAGFRSGVFIRRDDNLSGLDLISEGNLGDVYIANRFNSNTSRMSFLTKTAGTDATAMTILGDGNIGIGTSSPRNKLDFASSTNSQINVAGGQVAGLNSTPTNPDHAVPLIYLQNNYAPIGTGVGSAFVQGGNAFGAIANLGTNDSYALNLKTNNIARITVASNGNVGIGVTNPLAKLQISGGSANWNESQPGTTKGTIHLDPENSTDHYGNAITFASSDNTNAQAGIYVRGDGSYGTKMYFATTNNYGGGSYSRLMIDYTGNIGIGTNAPTQLLDVNGALRLGSMVAGSGTTTIFDLARRDGSYLARLTASDSSVSQNRYLRWNWPSTGNVDFIFENDNSGSANIIVDGNVGIGTTNPQQKLSIVGGNISLSQANSGSIGAWISNTSNSTFIGVANGTITGEIAGSTMLANQSSRALQFGTSNLVRATISSGGNFGINTTTPVTRLAVSDGTGNVIYAGGGQIGGLNSTPLNSDHAVPLGYLQANYTPASGSLWSGTKNGTIWNGDLGVGNVGIGTTTPAAKLNVVGTFAATASSSSIILDENGNVFIGI